MIAMAEFKFDEAAHVYTLDGQVIPSVTQLLAPIKPDFGMVPPAVLERKRQLGTAVHLACELDDADELDTDSLPDSLRPYLAAWRKFRNESGAVILENERREFHATLRFAGTIDRLADLVTRPEGCDSFDRWLLDIKTSAEPHPSYGVQLAGYQLLLNLENEKIRRGSVHLFPDGTYRLHEFKNHGDHAAFRACIALFNWSKSQ